MKKILGLDLGTNSIGWALVEIDDINKIVRILGLGSRILSMDAGEISTFEAGGKLPSTAAQRTTDRTTRKLNERFLLRRDRIHCVLNLLEALPEHYKVAIDFENEKGYRSGKFKKCAEVKLAYTNDDKGKSHFLFMDSYKEMVEEFKIINPSLFYKKKNGKETKIPYDWTQYYLRKKALEKEITKEELAWITLSFNQKRGYEKIIGQDEKKQKEGELSETFIGKVKSVTEIGTKEGQTFYEIILVDENNNETYRYKEESLFQITDTEDLKEVEIVSKYDEEGTINNKNTIYTVKEIRNLKISDVKYTDRKNKENTVYEVVLENGWIKEQLSKFLPKWKDTNRDFIIKTSYDIDGNRIIKGSDKGRNINAPKEEDWTLLKLKTETALSSFNTKNKTVGVASYIYSELLKNPNQKIKRDLITVIERKYYREELENIFGCQKQFHSELSNVERYLKAINLLYPNNKNHRNILESYLNSDEVLPFSKLITDDVILYQRDLKSKKSLIANCVYEKENYTKIDRKTGNEYQDYLKGIHKANPLYQEFRIWQFIKRLKIIQLERNVNNEILINQDVSETILKNGVKEKLFEYLNNREFITQSVLLKHLGLSEKEYKWNFEKEHKEPCNETRYNFIIRLKRIKGFDWKTFLTTENEYRIWHFFYSVKKQDEFKKGINSLFEKLLTSIGISQNNIKIWLDYKNDVVKNFSSFGGYTNDYGTYSEKALKKLLPFLRIGKYWDANVVENILRNTTHDVREKVLNKEAINGEIEDFQGLWISSACYLVYNRYSEVGDLQYWNTPYDIENFLQHEFKQHSLNNPVVEKVLVETLQLVKDIWKYFGVQDGIDEKGRPNFNKLFDRIHIELGREMKKNAKERAKESKQNNENKNTNDRIIELLKELRKENDEVRIKSLFQQEKLRILEDDLLSSIEYDKDATSYSFSDGYITKKEIKEITSKDISKISKSDFERYKLWLDQRYQSPYTGKFIKLSDLFNREKYEIEHIFPQERITLNALYNKVICETEVNKAKKALTGYQFILESKGTKVINCAAHNKEVTILAAEAYEKLVKSNFVDKRKQEILLSKDIPDEFTNSQLNNTRYISKMAMKLLSNVVREEGEDSFRSKNVLPITGVITTKLKQDWQLNDAWNELIEPRFKRLNEITNSNLFGNEELKNGHKVFINRVPEELSSDFDKKRIDHRHHAMDALVIALSTESHVNYLNNISAQDSKEDKLEQRIKIKNKITDTKKNNEEDKTRFFLPPAQYKQNGEIIKYTYAFNDTNTKVFKDVALEALQNTIVSFKQKSRIIKQRTNRYQEVNAEDGKIKLVSEQNLNKKSNYNVRQALHKATYYGKVKLSQNIKQVNLIEAIPQIDNIVDSELRELIINMRDIQKLSSIEIVSQLESKYSKVKVYEEYVASRYENYLENFASIDSDKISSTIESITDTGIQRILKNHLSKYKIEREDGKIIQQPEIAFSFDGVMELNANLKELNGGKDHKSIYKVRMSTPLGTKFPVSETGIKSTKYVVTKEGSNVFCGVYEERNTKKRKFLVPTLRETIESLKLGFSPCRDVYFDENTLEKYELIFILSPNDLVYIPLEEEIKNSKMVDFSNLKSDQINRIYKFVDGNSAEVMNFIPYYISKPLVDVSKDEYKKIGLSQLIFKDIKESKKGISIKEKELVNEIGMGSTQSKNQNSLNGVQIKSVCWKLKVDRLGNINLIEW